MATMKYIQVKEWLQEVALKPESKVRMPTIAETRRQFGVSLAPVARALRELENEGVIVCRQGSGIVATGQSAEVRTKGYSGQTEGSLVLAYPDFLSERIWEMVHTVEQHSLGKRLEVANYRFAQHSAWSDLVAFVQQQERCRGLIVLMGSGRIDRASLQSVAKLRMPIVLVDNMQHHDFLPENVYTIAPDPQSSGSLLANALLTRGHRRIGYVRNEPQCDYNAEKLKAIRSTIVAAGHAFTNDQIFGTTIKSWDSALDAACRLMQDNLQQIREMELTGLIFTSSPGAFAAASALARSGIAVPEEISIVGEGEYESARYMHPALTVVTCDYLEMHRLAVDVAAGDAPSVEQTTLLPCKTIHRESIHAVSGAGQLA